MFNRRYIVSAQVFSLLVILSAYSQAMPATFVLDSAQSSLKIQAVVDFGAAQLSTVGQGDAVEGVFPDHVGLSDGSVTFYSGTINAFVTPGSIQFTGGSVIDAHVSSNELGWAPEAGGGPDNNLTFEPADYGLVLAIVYASIQDAIFDTTSGALARVGDTFSADHSMVFTSGLLSFVDIAGLFIEEPGSSDLTMLPGLDSSGSDGTLVANGTLLTLSLPVSISQAIMLGDVPVDLVITGTLVGTFVIPEPASMALLGSAGVLLGAFAVARGGTRRRKHARKEVT